MLLKLLIAHFLGDFVLQSNELIKAKYESWKGTLKHALIVTSVAAATLFAYLGDPRTYLLLGLLAGTHFVQDVNKVIFDKYYNPKRSPLPFFADQAMHLFVLWVLVTLYSDLSRFELPNWVNAWYESPMVLTCILLVILVTYTFDITVYQFKRKKQPKEPYHPDYKHMLGRLLAFGVSLLVLFVLNRLGWIGQL